MVGERELIRLAERKREIMLENDRARQRLAEQLSNARSLGSTVDAGVDRARRLGPWLLLVAPAVARQGKGVVEIVRAARSGLSWMSTIREVAAWLGRR
jgi:hypothetical protein